MIKLRNIGLLLTFGSFIFILIGQFISIKFDSDFAQIVAWIIPVFAIVTGVLMLIISWVLKK